MLHGYDKSITELEYRTAVERGKPCLIFLLGAMRSSRLIQELAANPLLLTLLAVLGRNQVLPRQRWQLLEHAANVLVMQWDVNRHLRERDVVEFVDAEDKKQMLQAIAFEMQAGAGGLAGNALTRFLPKTRSATEAGGWPSRCWRSWRLLRRWRICRLLTGWRHGWRPAGQYRRP